MIALFVGKLTKLFQNWLHCTVLYIRAPIQNWSECNLAHAYKVCCKCSMAASFVNRELYLWLVNEWASLFCIVSFGLIKTKVYSIQIETSPFVLLIELYCVIVTPYKWIPQLTRVVQKSKCTQNKTILCQKQKYHFKIYIDIQKKKSIIKQRSHYYRQCNY